MSNLFLKYFFAIAAILACIGFVATIPFNSTEKGSVITCVVVGLQSGYPPFEFMDPSRALLVMIGDVAKQISDKLGKTLVIKDMEFEGRNSFTQTRED